MPLLRTKGSKQHRQQVDLNDSSFSGATNPLAATQFPGVEYLGHIGTKVKVTARINPQNEVTLHLNLEVSSLTAQSFNGIPVISNESIEQTIRLRDNETSMVMGIRQLNHSNALNGTPPEFRLSPALEFSAARSRKQTRSSDLNSSHHAAPRSMTPRKENHFIYAGPQDSTGRQHRFNNSPTVHSTARGSPRTKLHRSRSLSHNRSLRRDSATTAAATPTTASTRAGPESKQRSSAATSATAVGRAWRDTGFATGFVIRLSVAYGVTSRTTSG